MKIFLFVIGLLFIGFLSVAIAGLRRESKTDEEEILKCNDSMSSQ